MKNSAFCFIAMNIASFVTPIIIHFLPHAKERKVSCVLLSSKSLELLNTSYRLLFRIHILLKLFPNLVGLSVDTNKIALNLGAGHAQLLISRDLCSEISS